MMDDARVGGGPPAFRRFAVAIYPTGIACILADLSVKYPPDAWTRNAVGEYKGWRAECIVAEKNYGVDMVEGTIKLRIVVSLPKLFQRPEER